MSSIAGAKNARSRPQRSHGRYNLGSTSEWRNRQTR